MYHMGSFDESVRNSVLSVARTKCRKGYILGPRAKRFPRQTTSHSTTRAWRVSPVAFGTPRLLRSPGRKTREPWQSPSGLEHTNTVAKILDAVRFLASHCLAPFRRRSCDVVRVHGQQARSEVHAVLSRLPSRCGLACGARTLPSPHPCWSLKTPLSKLPASPLGNALALPPQARSEVLNSTLNVREDVHTGQQVIYCRFCTWYGCVSCHKESFFPFLACSTR